MFKKAKPLKDHSDYNHAWEYALFLLNISMRTMAEMQDKMKTRGYDDAVIIKVIQALIEQRFLDDQNYAEVFINNMKRYKTWGRFMMKKKLFEKRLPKELIEQSLGELVSSDDEVEIALRYLKREFGNQEDIKNQDYQTKQKIMSRLSSRGFGVDIIQKLL